LDWILASVYVVAFAFAIYKLVQWLLNKITF